MVMETRRVPASDPEEGEAGGQEGDGEDPPGDAEPHHPAQIILSRAWRHLRGAGPCPRAPSPDLCRNPSREAVRCACRPCMRSSVTTTCLARRASPGRDRRRHDHRGTAPYFAGTNLFFMGGAVCRPATTNPTDICGRAAQTPTIPDDRTETDMGCPCAPFPCRQAWFPKRDAPGEPACLFTLQGTRR